jgi:glycosyltransferase involved in cell wall biosynthesis
MNLPNQFATDGVDYRPVHSLHTIFGFHNPLGGAVHAALGVCQHLAEAGHPVDIAGTHAAGDDVAYLSQAYPAVRPHFFSRSFPARNWNSAAFKEWLPGAIARYDWVEIHTIFAGITWHAARACRRAGKPYFVRPHGSLDPFDLKKRAGLKRWLGPLLVRPVLAGAAGVVLTSTLEAERLVTFGAQVPRLVMPLPVPLPLKPGVGGEFRRRHGIPEDALVVLFMSRVDYKKGLDFLIPALGRLRSEFPRLWFVLAGTGEPAFTERVKGWLATHGLMARTSVVGFVSGADKQNALAAADVFALPSLNENFGIVLIEAMHAGLPLLISDEVYIHGEIAQAGAGLVCRPETGSVTDTLRALLAGAEVRATMGRRGRELVQQRYRPEAATELLVRAYRDRLPVAGPRVVAS